MAGPNEDQVESHSAHLRHGDLVTLHGLEPGDLGQLLADGSVLRGAWRKGITIASQGERQAQFFVVLSGQLDVTRSRFDGSRHIIDMVGPGFACGAVTAFAPDPRWPADVHASEPTQALVVPTMSLMAANPASPSRQLLLQWSVRLLAERAAHLNQRAELLSRRGLRARLAFFMMHNCDERGMVDIALTRQELADSLQVSRSSMTRELGRMAAEGLVALHGRAFEVLDSQTLRLLAR